MRIGIDLGGTKIEGVVIAEDNQVLWRKRIAVPEQARGGIVVQDPVELEKSYQLLIETIVELIGYAIAEIPALADLPVGFGTPGAETSSGVMKNCNSVCLNGRALGSDLEQRLQRPVRLANDANCFALAEAVMGAGSGADSVFGVILGTGVGGGLVFDKSLHSGVNAIAGEWGHNPVSSGAIEQARPCYCGRVNCVETWLSGAGLRKTYAFFADANEVEVETIIERYRGGENQALKALRFYFEQLGRALATVVNVVDPDVIVLGGGLSNIDELYSEVPALWGKHIFSETVSTELKKAQLGDSAGVFGAAWLWSD